MVVSVPKSKTHDLNKSSSILDVLSDFPSVLGWNTILNFNYVPIASLNSFHTLAVNLESLLDIMDIDVPCNLTISSM